MPFAKQAKQADNSAKPAEGKKESKKFDVGLLLIPLVIVAVGLFLFGFIRSRMNGGKELKANTAVLSSPENLPRAAQEVAHTVEQAVAEPVKVAVETVKRFYFGMDD